MYGEASSRAPFVLESNNEAVSSWGAQRSLDFNVEGSNARVRFREFFRNFRIDNDYIYRNSLIQHWNRNEYFVEVDLAHVNEFDEVLFNNLQVNKIIKHNHNCINHNILG